MKKIQFIIHCLTAKIKKYFFNVSKSDLSYDCKDLFAEDRNATSTEDLKYAEEYLENYKVTTRWQTL